MTDESKAAAEDYRKQRQRAEAQRQGFVFTTDTFDKWLSQNEDLLRDLARANGSTDEEIEELLSEYKDRLAAHWSGSEYDDKNLRAIVGPILVEIENLCVEQKIPVRNGVVYGVAPEFGLLASQREVLLTEVSIIDVSIPFIIFCNSISKALARTLVHERGSMIKVSNDPAAVLGKLRASPELIREWTTIVVHHALGWPPSRLSPAPDRIEQVTRILLLKSIEWFALAHEFGHHVMKHGQATSSGEARNVFDDEHEADLFARAASMALAIKEEPLNFYALSGVGGVVVLGMMDIVRRARSVLLTGVDNPPPRTAHPPVDERIQVIGLLDRNLPPDQQDGMRMLRDCFAEIIEGIWQTVLPVAQRLHDRGVRPNQPGKDGWLPNSSER